MDNKGPHETLKAELLADCNPIPVDDVYLKMIENGEEELSDDLFFKLIKESPAWLSTTPFLKKIAQWQFTLGNSLFDFDEQVQAKKNLFAVGKALANKGKSRGRSRTISDDVLRLKYEQLVRVFTTFFDKHPIDAIKRLPALLEEYPIYKGYFDLRAKRRYTTPGEIAVRIIVNEAGVSLRTVYSAIKKP
ncbi:MAG TPA: hypothetical protein PLX02_02750 [Syntrophorhabdaceae bacterium]|nr:hypothetical protein [Syntrophorhabdaceae bacterium]